MLGLHLAELLVCPVGNLRLLVNARQDSLVLGGEHAHLPVRAIHHRLAHGV